MQPYLEVPDQCLSGQNTVPWNPFGAQKKDKKTVCVYTLFVFAYINMVYLWHLRSGWQPNEMVNDALTSDFTVPCWPWTRVVVISLPTAFPPSSFIAISWSCTLGLLIQSLHLPSLKSLAGLFLLVSKTGWVSTAWCIPCANVLLFKQQLPRLVKGLCRF